MFIENTRQFKFVIFNLEVLGVLLFTWKLVFSKDLDLLFTILVAIIYNSLSIENVQLNFQAAVFGNRYRENFYWKKNNLKYTFLSIEASAFFSLKRNK